MLSLSRKIATEARYERELSAALLRYKRAWEYATCQSDEMPDHYASGDLLTAARNRVESYETLLNVVSVRCQLTQSLADLANEGTLGTLARDVLDIGARRAYERLRANYLDSTDET